MQNKNRNEKTTSLTKGWSALFVWAQACVLICLSVIKTSIAISCYYLLGNHLLKNCFFVNHLSIAIKIICAINYIHIWFVCMYIPRLMLDVKSNWPTMGVEEAE